MPRRDLRAELRACEDLTSDASQQLLRHVLRKGSFREVKLAAELIGGHQLGLAAPLQESFRRLTQNASQVDPGCEAKLAIVKALRHLQEHDGEFFREGIRFHQWDPVWGKTIDVAGPLRAECAFGLVESNDSQAVRALVDLLADREPAARAGAARALGWLRGLPAEMILRFKVQQGDSSPEVLGECLSGLLAMDPESALPFAEAYLQRGTVDESAEAAMALGSSRYRPAFELLVTQGDIVRDVTRLRSIFVALAISQHPDAIGYLLGRIDDADPCIAIVALSSLRNAPNSAALRDRVAGSVAGCQDRSIADAWQREWMACYEQAQ